MIEISREQALCMFFYEEYNETNAARLSKLIDDLGNIEICYIDDDPTEPLLISHKRLYSKPFTYLKYPAILEGYEEDKDKN
ncbi:uncharacterized protein EV154DRAFT_526029 [Mucor mucedo]|uniref:uncharacterized protein n=1 Tax=Mucor mucedo TaxID=29922 RepID=UPI002220244F|nr:uncharacterized protein EV154DRAFT_526029 [Mucor mucedo]KAI7876508.1 hypothetical protein EV154DRAFT_526029 [Mucor mucedo]